MTRIDTVSVIWSVRPIIAYHATCSPAFEKFDTSRGDLGAHFGQLSQAAHISLNRHGGRPESHVMKVRLHLQSPLRLKDVGSFHADGIARQLDKKGILPPALKGRGKQIEKEIEADWKKRRVYDPILRQAIIDAGYDSVKYANTNEGAGDSYIAFFPEQIEILEQHVNIDDFRHLRKTLHPPVIEQTPTRALGPATPACD